MRARREKISGWGRFPVQECMLVRPEKYRRLAPPYPIPDSIIPRGLGRSYGDASLNEGGQVLLTERVNRFLAFDREKGVVRAESGVTIADLLQAVLPAGWFPAVVPGTRHVTLGGCVAADVHGKNHHRDGSFGDHLLAMDLITASGGIMSCTPAQDAELFRATVGGMGLTGVVGEIEMQLRPVTSAYIMANHSAARNLDELLQYFADPDHDDHYTVAWIDSLAEGQSLGRGVLIRGHHASPEELPASLRSRPFAYRGKPQVSIPVNFPNWVLNSLTGKVFNEIYFRRQSSRTKAFVIDCERFFFPLDALLNWNRMYGRRGFVQYQCVLGGSHADTGLRSLLEELHKHHCFSFLAVLKRFGKGNDCLLSFPGEGYTLALDIPVTKGEIMPLLDKLDQTVLAHSGRVYLAKDARLSADVFRAMYPEVDRWLQVKRSVDPNNLFSSSLSRRLKLEPSHA